MRIRLKHNMEIAHRLFLMPGKCQQIHGHSMKVEMTLHGLANEKGIFENLDFGDVKREFRHYIDTTYDHKLLLNEADPWAQALGTNMHESNSMSVAALEYLPGLVRLPGDPTTENIAQWIHTWAVKQFRLRASIYVQETDSNGVGVE